MDFTSVAEGFGNIEKIYKVAAAAIPLILAAVAVARMRIGLVRKYLRAAKRISTLDRYLRTRAEAFRVLTCPLVAQIERLEEIAAERLGIILEPAACGLRGYWYPFDRSYLTRVVRQLDDVLFRDFVQDLHERLILLLDGYVDIINLQATPGRLIEHAAFVTAMEVLRKTTTEDIASFELQVDVAANYLNGKAAVDICTTKHAGHRRLSLNEKYRTYANLEKADSNR